MRFPRVLVISNNCFSYSNSNGRTLGNFFINWDKDCIAQFYIQSELPSSDVCKNYYRITDNELLKSFFTLKKYGKILKEKDIIYNTEKTRTDIGFERIIKTSKIRRTPFLQLARNLLWYSKKWKTKKFCDWADSFDPEILVLQVGDSIFMYDIAQYLSTQYNTPLVIYNSEDYYLKDKKSISPIYSLYRRLLKNKFDRLMSNTDYVIYICDLLKNNFDKIFDIPSEAIYTASTFFSNYEEKENNPPIISYLGNIELERWKSLVQIGKNLNLISNNYFIDVYTQKVPKEAIKELVIENGIRLKGSVPYDEVIRIMRSSDLLIHTESISGFNKWDLKHAFSTKIADSLSCGTCLFVYGPEEIASIKYLKENRAAYVITDKKNLLSGLKEIISDKELRRITVKRALDLAKKNHNADANSRRFEKIIRTVLDIGKQN